MSEVDLNIKIINNSSILNMIDIRKFYSNLYYFNHYMGSSINKINPNISIIPINKNKSRNKIPIVKRKFYSFVRQLISKCSKNKKGLFEF